MTQAVNDTHVEQDFEHLQQLAAKAWMRPLPEVQALAERIRVELLVRKPERKTSAFYHAAIHYFEDVADLRHDREQADRAHTHSRALDYVRDLLKGIDLT
jgi:hypothetical protein